jgi:hypothetical protein
MNEDELKVKIANDFQAVIADIAAAETLQGQDNPFYRVTFGREFLEAQLSAPVLSDEELMKVASDIDKAIEENRSLQEVVGLLKTGLTLLSKYGVIL